MIRAKLSIENLTFSMNGKTILKDISLSVDDGEFLGLMGPNGSGKTTLLRCIMKYLMPQKGAVLIDAKPIHTLKEKELARLLAVVPQSSQLDFSFTAYEIVMMGRLPYAGSRLISESKKDEEAVRRAMDRTDTWEFANRQFSSLSGGERQRVIIARALAQDPKILLLDEPTVFLDITGQFEIMDLLRDLNREGLTIIAVLHDVNLASRYCRKIALLNEGRLEFVGVPEEVFTAKNIMRIYGLDVVIRRDPVTRSISAVPKDTLSVPIADGPRVHVICGGGSGTDIFRQLIDAGYSLSAGVVNILDSDFENAKALHVPTITEIPFAQIGEESYGRNLGIMKDAEAVIVSDFPIGPGNIRNLEAALQAQKEGKRVLVVDPDSVGDRDFVGGRGKRMVEDLLHQGATAVRSKSEIIEILRTGGTG